MDIIQEFNEYAVTDIQQALVLMTQTRANTSILGFNKNKPHVTARNIIV